MTWHLFGNRGVVSGRYDSYESKLFVAVTGSGSWVTNEFTYKQLGMPEAVLVYADSDGKNFAIAPTSAQDGNGYKVTRMSQRDSNKLFTFAASSFARAFNLIGPKNHAHIYLGTPCKITDRISGVAFQMFPRSTL